MTNDELNEYIKHYLEKDHTGRAIMLTGAWGTGKSYYIKNSLVPFLAKPDNGAHKCIVVSLYGISEISEISKTIYLEARVKSALLESEAAKATILTGKTVVKGVASFFGIDLTVKEQDLQQLYESIDLSGKLVIFEDVERTSIDLIQFLGYVSSMTEQDGVKVLLVANERELIRYEPITQTDNTNKTVAIQQSKRTYTAETEKYLKVKEKTIEDTIAFRGDFETAIREIVDTFNNITIKRFSFDPHIKNIIDIMKLKRNFNLRSLLFACQKTVDIYERIGDIESLPEDFIQAVYYGVVFFSLTTTPEAAKPRWDGSDFYSLRLGSQEYPLFKFCYDYIVNQRLDKSVIPDTITAFDKLTKYNHNKANADPDLIILENYLIHSEKEVQETVTRLASRLRIPGNVSFPDYGRIAVVLIKIKDELNIEVDEVKKLLVENIKNTREELDEDDIIWVPLKESSEKANDEYNHLRDEMLREIYEKAGIIPGFHYLPEQAEMFKEYVINNVPTFQKKRGFLRFLDTIELVNMYSRCCPEQMNSIYEAFYHLYHNGNMWANFREDASNLEALIKGLEVSCQSPDIDKIQQIQCKRFIEELASIKSVIA